MYSKINLKTAQDQLTLTINTNCNSFENILVNYEKDNIRLS